MEAPPKRGALPQTQKSTNDLGLLYKPKSCKVALRRGATLQLSVIYFAQVLIPIPKMALPFWESQNLTGFGI